MYKTDYLFIMLLMMNGNYLAIVVTITLISKAADNYNARLYLTTFPADVIMFINRRLLVTYEGFQLS